MNNNKIKKYLIISLLINALLIGMLISGAFLRHRSFDERHPKIGRFLSKKSLYKKGRRIRRSKEKIKEALLKEPFDENLVRRAFDESLKERNKIQKEIHEKIREKIISEAKDLSPEERTKLIDNFRRSRKKGRQKGFGRKRKHKRRNRY